MYSHGYGGTLFDSQCIFASAVSAMPHAKCKLQYIYTTVVLKFHTVCAD